MVANMGIGFGSIVASDSFPPGDDNFLVVVGTGACKYPQGSCNLDINFPSIFLDGRRRAQCLQVNHVMGATLGPGSYLLNFTKAGVQINGGHEVGRGTDRKHADRRSGESHPPWPPHS